MPPRTPTRIAAVLVILEAIGLLVLTAWQIAAIIGGDTAAIDSALALAVLTAAAAGIVAVFGVVTWRGTSWGRSGAIVTQLLILAVALGAITGAYGHPSTAAAIAAPAVVILVLLVLGMRAPASGKDNAAASDQS